MKKSLVILLLIILPTGAWLYFSLRTHSHFQSVSEINKTRTAQALIKRTDFTLTDLQGQPQNFSQWDNQVVLLNFWATWCPPCRREMPDFIDVYEQYKDQGFVIVGVGIDNKQRIADFVDALGVSYPVLTGESEAMKVSRQYGNRHGALPYSIIIDKQGMIRYKTAGLVSKQQLVSWIEPLL